MTHANKAILVVDDDPDFQDSVATILKNAGYHVFQAFSKEEGLRMLEDAKPDLVILDIMMETTSAGFHFLYETLGDGKQEKPHVPVLAVSSISQRTGFKFSPTDDGDYFPADDYLEKPVSAEALLEHVRILLEKNKLWRARNGDRTDASPIVS